MTAVAAASPQDVLARAYAECEQLARSHYENFPVASLLLPKRMRPAIAAIYAFARRADDVADEPGYADDERLRLLDDWSERLRRCTGPAPPASTSDDLVFVALGDAIRTHQLPLSLLEDLLSAFRQDVTVSRYATWSDVLDYCSRSANPVGRLVLLVGGYRDEARARWSDDVCTALQLTNFWQDFARDWRNGRLYVPLDVRDRHGASDADLDAGRMTEAWRAALREVVSRTRTLFDRGRPICDAVDGRLKLELRATWLGGTRILERLEQSDFAAFDARPTLGGGDALLLSWRALRWKAS